MLKALKEDLARANQDYVKQLANDTDWMFRFTPETMTKEDLVKEAKQMSKDLLSLRSHDLFMFRLSKQVQAFREAFDFCDVLLASQRFPNFVLYPESAATSHSTDSFDAKKFAQQQQCQLFLAVLQEQIDAVIREATSIKTESPLAQIPIRNGI